MKNVIVYGSGCSNCTVTLEKLQAFAKANDIEVQVTKETDMMAIMQAGVMSTPGVSVDGQVVHTGSVPNDAQVAKIFA